MGVIIAKDDELRILYRYYMDTVSIPIRYTEIETKTDTKTRPIPDKTNTETFSQTSALEDRV